MRTQYSGFGTIVLVLAVLLPACAQAAKPQQPAGPRWGEFDKGWVKLPNPPEIRGGASLAFTGSELLYWGGRSPSEKAAATDGFAFDPATREWREMPAAPGPGRIGAEAISTGREVLFLEGSPGKRLDGVAYDPAGETWRRIPPAPVPLGEAVHVWTGDEVVVWGGGDPGDKTNTSGAAYDPSKDRWRVIADAPIALNSATGVWAKRWVAVYGSLLNNGNHASTQYAEGALYNPAKDRWRLMSDGSRLSPQASSMVWRRDGGGGALVAWDYETRFQVPEDPWGYGWSKKKKMPFEFSECYPDSTVFDNERIAFAWFCGQAATYTGGNIWHRVRGGPLDDKVETKAGAEYQLWRFAELAPAGDVVAMELEGITVGDPQSPGDSGVCYGCPGAPTSFWVYGAENS